MAVPNYLCDILLSGYMRSIPINKSKNTILINLNRCISKDIEDLILLYVETLLHYQPFHKILKLVVTDHEHKYDECDDEIGGLSDEITDDELVDNQQTTNTHSLNISFTSQSNIIDLFDCKFNSLYNYEKRIICSCLSYYVSDDYIQIESVARRILFSKHNSFQILDICDPIGGHIRNSAHFSYAEFDKDILNILHSYNDKQSIIIYSMHSKQSGQQCFDWYKIALKNLINNFLNDPLNSAIDIKIIQNLMRQKVYLMRGGFEAFINKYRDNVALVDEYNVCYWIRTDFINNTKTLKWNVSTLEFTNYLRNILISGYLRPISKHLYKFFSKDIESLCLLFAATIFQHKQVCQNKDVKIIKYENKQVIDIIFDNKFHELYNYEKRIICCYLPTEIDPYSKINIILKKSKKYKCKYKECVTDIHENGITEFVDKKQIYRLDLSNLGLNDPNILCFINIIEKNDFFINLKELDLSNNQKVTDKYFHLLLEKLSIYAPNLDMLNLNGISSSSKLNKFYLNNTLHYVNKAYNKTKKKRKKKYKVMAIISNEKNWSQL
eukprot:60086_1